MVESHPSWEALSGLVALKSRDSTANHPSISKHLVQKSSGLRITRSWRGETSSKAGQISSKLLASRPAQRMCPADVLELQNYQSFLSVREGEGDTMRELVAM